MEHQKFTYEKKIANFEEEIYDLEEENEELKVEIQSLKENEIKLRSFIENECKKM